MLTRTPMAPGYISLAYFIDFRMIKLYLLPICWQSMEDVAFHSISSNLSSRSGISVREFLGCNAQRLTSIPF